jgi:hypothetical protein
MHTYTSLDGDVFDLSTLTDAERAHLEICVAAYRAGLDWAAFHDLASGRGNPHIRATGGLITRTVWHHPLFRATRDLEDRLGIHQGKVGAHPGDDLDRDPFDDAWVPVSEAAARKGVTVPGLHQAIRRGTVIARRAAPGGSRLLVSVNSLARWTPNPVRQNARRKPVTSR